MSLLPHINLMRSMIRDTKVALKQVSWDSSVASEIDVAMNTAFAKKTRLTVGVIEKFLDGEKNPAEAALRQLLTETILSCYVPGSEDMLKAYSVGSLVMIVNKIVSKLGADVRAAHDSTSSASIIKAILSKISTRSSEIIFADVIKALSVRFLPHSDKYPINCRVHSVSSSRVHPLVTVLPKMLDVLAAIHFNLYDVNEKIVKFLLMFVRAEQVLQNVFAGKSTIATAPHNPSTKELLNCDVAAVWLDQSFYLVPYTEAEISIISFVMRSTAKDVSQTQTAYNPAFPALNTVDERYTGKGLEKIAPSWENESSASESDCDEESSEDSESSESFSDGGEESQIETSSESEDLPPYIGTGNVTYDSAEKVWKEAPNGSGVPLLMSGKTFASKR